MQIIDQKISSIDRQSHQVTFANGSIIDDVDLVIGDAAHPMSPFKGQRANQALLDALDLSEILKGKNEKDLHLLINEYEKRVESKVMQSR